jgi:hypothetical protein
MILLDSGYSKLLIIVRMYSCFRGKAKYYFGLVDTRSHHLKAYLSILFNHLWCFEAVESFKDGNHTCSADEKDGTAALASNLMSACTS